MKLVTIKIEKETRRLILEIYKMDLIASFIILLGMIYRYIIMDFFTLILDVLFLAIVLFKIKQNKKLLKLKIVGKYPKETIIQTINDSKFRIIILVVITIIFLITFWYEAIAFSLLFIIGLYKTQRLYKRLLKTFR